MAGRTSFGRLLLEKVPLILLTLVACIVTMVVQRGAAASLQQVTPALRAENAVVAYGKYCLKIFWPQDLAVIYPFEKDLPVTQLLVAAAAFIGISVLSLLVARRHPYCLVGWLWFVGTLIPVIGLIQVGSQSMADRYTYIPSVGIFMALAWGAAEVVSRWALFRRPLAVVGTATLAGCWFAAQHQIGYWQNGERLFRHTMAVTTKNFIACGALGAILDGQGRIGEALHLCAESVEMEPRCPENQYNLGCVLLEMGKTDEAIKHLESAIEENPQFANAENNLGKAYGSKGKLDDAMAHMRSALRLVPDDPEFHYNLGTLLYSVTNIPEAVVQFSEAVRLDPDYALAHGNLAVALVRLGRTTEALEEFSEAVRTAPSDPDAHSNFGQALMEQGRTNEAIGQFDTASRLRPESANAQYRLAVALARAQRLPEAISHCREALRLQPDFAAALSSLNSWTTGNVN